MPLISLLENLGFIVLGGAHAADDVIAALPRTATHQGRKARRLALAETLHVGDCDDSNDTELAIFTCRDKTIIAPPSAPIMAKMLVLEAPLSRRFGEVAAFYSIDYAPGICLTRDGEEVAWVNEGEVFPKEGFMGFRQALSAEQIPDIMRKAFVAYVGAPWDEIFPRVGAEADFFTLD